jgi:hypothetical protein
MPSNKSTHLKLSSASLSSTLIPEWGMGRCKFAVLSGKLRILAKARKRRPRTPAYSHQIGKVQLEAKLLNAPQGHLVLEALLDCQ